MKIKEILNRYWAIFAVIFVLLWQGIAMPVIIFLAGFQSIPQEIIEAARMDGANDKQIFWNIEITYLLPSISMVFIMALKGGLTAFGFGILIARALNANIKGKTFFRAWFFFPAVLSGVVVSLVFKQIFNYGLPKIGSMLGIEFLQTSLLGTTWGAIFAVIFVLLWQGIAMPVIIFLAGFQSIPQEIIEAARMDGANDKQIFWNIEITISLPFLIKRLWKISEDC
ncbi:hypothetical protein EfmAA242_31490 (plasmid) [Enterococcus faecium]|nr:hypothetical protein EfmAA242_31490 [Enterococcus faecium]